MNKIVYLKDHFPELGQEGCNAFVECYINEPIVEMGDNQTTCPCIVICPGGGYSVLSEREGSPIALHFASEGYCVFVLHYSVNPHSFPQQLREVAGVMELIHLNQKEWNCDISNITIMGFSAGGHLAAQYSNRYDCREIREIFPISRPVHRAVLGYPVITADKKYTHAITRRNYLGYEPEEEENTDFSCDMLVTEKTPPTFIWHTAEDPVVPVENSLLYAKKLSQYKVPYELHIYPYGPHGMAAADKRTCVGLTEKTSHCHQWIEECKKWLRL